MEDKLLSVSNFSGTENEFAGSFFSKPRAGPSDPGRYRKLPMLGSHTTPMGKRPYAIVTAGAGTRSVTWSRFRGGLDHEF